MYPYGVMNEYENSDNSYVNQEAMKMPMQVSCIDPYVVSALMTLRGQRVVVETVRGSLNGNIIDVKPDHIVLGEMYDDSRFFIRIAEIVHIMPIGNNSSNPQYRY